MNDDTVTDIMFYRDILFNMIKEHIAKNQLKSVKKIEIDEIEIIFLDETKVTLTMR